MRLLITGKPRSGKSLYAERLLEERETRLGYVGTLPLIPRFSERILTHRKRRDHRWDLFEITGDWERDVDRLDGFFQTRPIVLLDGLSILIWAELRPMRGPWESGVKLLHEGIVHILRRSRASWAVVDVDSPYPDEEPYREFNLAAQRLHEALVHSCGASIDGIEGTVGAASMLNGCERHAGKGSTVRNFVDDARAFSP